MDYGIVFMPLINLLFTCTVSAGQRGLSEDVAEIRQFVMQALGKVLTEQNYVGGRF